ncbi:MAG: methylated-DNA--[protein]-cysteine S-methyltransferase [Planctomycetaceae bacterium]|jgi:methylated-DNA-[protein]-cysteine S-methyltransferase|nr:methylated-DNA--[protein]-cysteine S-methyltransferase [Planctomycetaceae bacterium]
MIYQTLIETKIGRIGLAEEDHFLTHLFFRPKKSPANAVDKKTSFLRDVAKQLHEYLDGKRKEFDVPLKLYGTDFQLSVWNALQTIPYGETRSYGEIARQIGNAKAYRAVGMANHWNPIAIIVPCHRVIGADGSLTGFGGGLPLKRQLLELEVAC